MRASHVARLLRRIGFEVVARICPANVRPNRAREAVPIDAVSERVVCRERGIVGVRCVHERRSARPAANHLRRQPDHVAGIGGASLAHGLVVQRAPEDGDVLLQLAVDHERPVAAKVMSAIGAVVRVLERRQDPVRID